MSRDPLTRRRAAFLAGTALIALLLFGMGSLRSHSATYDEPMHIAAGYSLWVQRDVRMDQNNPPLAKLLEALPVVHLRPHAQWDTREWKGAFHYSCGERFLYWSGNDAAQILRRAKILEGGESRL